MARNILTMFLGNLPKPEHSYNSTQGHILAAMLKERGIEVDIPYFETIPDTGPDDTIYLYLGFGYNPESTDINVFGGMKNCGDFTCNHLTWLSNHKGKLVTLEHPFPDYSTIIKNKLKGLTDVQMERWKDLNLDGFKRFHEESEFIEYANSTVADKIIVGDSHAYSLYRPGYMVNSVPHKTLFGALKDGIQSFVPTNCGNISEVEVMFGNIDVRHHLCRQDDPEAAAKKLASNTVESMIDMCNNLSCTSKFYELLPIENESRKLSKSGWYKGSPFYGSWEERNTVRNIFNSEMEKLSDSDTITFVKWTDRYLNQKGELDFQFMEKPRGVHLSGAHFPYWSRNGNNALEALFS